MNRRDFARLVALSGSAALFPSAAIDDLTAAPLPAVPAQPGEPFWRDVRSRFLLPPALNFLNAANLCPTSLPAIEAMGRNQRLYERSKPRITRTTRIMRITWR